MIECKGHLSVAEELGKFSRITLLSAVKHLAPVKMHGYVVEWVYHGALEGSLIKKATGAKFIPLYSVKF